MRNAIRILSVLLLVSSLLLLSACADSRGDVIRYEGCTVRTERRAPEPTDTVTAERADLTRSGGTEAEESSYIVNMNTMKFHLPTCPSAAAIQEKNRWSFTGSRETLIEMGYSPCKECSP